MSYFDVAAFLMSLPHFGQSLMPALRHFYASGRRAIAVSFLPAASFAGRMPGRFGQPAIRHCYGQRFRGDADFSGVASLLVYHFSVSGALCLSGEGNFFRLSLAFFLRCRFITFISLAFYLLPYQPFYFSPDYHPRQSPSPALLPGGLPGFAVCRHWEGRFL